MLFSNAVGLVGSDPEGLALCYRQAITRGDARIFQDFSLSTKTYDEALEKVDKEMVREGSELNKSEEYSTLESRIYQSLLPALKTEDNSYIIDLSVAEEACAESTYIFDPSIFIRALQRYLCKPELRETFIKCVSKDRWNCLVDAQNETLESYFLSMYEEAYRAKAP